MILTIGPHPSLEKNVFVSNFEPGKPFRLTDMLIMAGSKGFNFTRALRTLGQDARLVAPLAGHTGQRVYDLAKTEGFDLVEVWIAGETRTIMNISDPITGQETELIENGPAVSAADWEKFKAAALGQLTQARWMAMCGSFLPGTPPDGPSELVKAANAAGLNVILDTYGPALNLSLPYRPALVKINRQEAGGVLNKSINSPAEALHAAAEIQALGPQAVVITLGAAGAVGLDAAGQTFGWASPRVNSLCPVGSGDSLLAGVVTGLVRGESLKEATRLGVAAGAANTLQLGPSLFEPAMVKTLLAQIEPLV